MYTTVLTIRYVHWFIGIIKCYSFSIQLIKTSPSLSSSLNRVFLERSLLPHTGLSPLTRRSVVGLCPFSYTCSVPNCRSNYKGEPYSSFFGLSKCQDLANELIRAIYREGALALKSVYIVCIKDFSIRNTLSWCVYPIYLTFQA